jgi:hypothetical protein
MLNILLINLLENAITQIKSQAQTKLLRGSSISSSNSEKIRALGNIMPCPPRLINDNINPNAE